jgi:RNA polymerase sigma factor (TIGR02999 family)
MEWSSRGERIGRTKWGMVRGARRRMASLLMRSASTPTALLLAWERGEAGALDRLMPLVHAELRRLARRHMAHERPGQTLQATALVHEAYLRLVEISQVRWQNRAQFFGLAARVMRHVLVDAARARGNEKRGGGRRVSLEEARAVSQETNPDVLALDAALQALEHAHARKARVVEMRFFGGLSLEETSAVLQVSVDTVKRDWRFAKLWLLKELSGATASGH